MDKTRQHSSFSLEALKEYFNKNKKKYIADFLHFLRFQSIATDPDFKPEVIQCKNWLVEALKSLGLEVEVWETDNAPTIFATDSRCGKDKPTLLLYNHYDVQPVDPLNLWTTPPFDPHIRDGQVYARGAVDNKGQCFYTLIALKALIDHYGHVPLNLKWIIEGEEESGSAGLFKLLPEKKEKLKADHLLIIDSGIHYNDAPSITLGARGIITLTITVTGSKIDLHSGIHGGIAYNPNRALIELLATLHDAEGKVNIPGFYDGVEELSSQERHEIDFSFDQDEYTKMFGAIPSSMEKGIPPHEAAWIRPTIEFNGICGGYAGAGFKTVIPAVATAKISCRLVPNQDPSHITDLLVKTLKERVNKAVNLSFEVHDGKGPGFRTSPHSKIARTVSAAYEDIFQKPCKAVLIGGSIPIGADLAKAAEAEMVLMGLSLPDDQIHAPNEHFGIDRLEKGFLSVAHLIQLLTH